MDVITLDEFIADIETTFRNYADSNDIDRNSVKSWVIECLRRFGKNICDNRETIVKVENSRAVLPETFRSMLLGLRLYDDFKKNEDKNKRLIVERQKIENPAYWSDVTLDYFVNYCDTKITTEKIYTHYEYENQCFNYEWLSVVKGLKSDSISTKCLNLNPIIQNNFPHKVSITARTMNTNFKNGLVYLQYTSLPSDENNEVVIPIISTGDIEKYIKNYIKIQLVETLTINDKNADTLKQWASNWLQQDRKLFIEAQSEANWSGFTEGWDKRIYAKNRENQSRFNLPSKPFGIRNIK